MSYHFLMDLALILLSTKILGLAAQKFQMPQVVGALIAGLILSPAGLGLLSETEFTAQLSELGVIVLMFSAGMGTDIKELKNSGKAGFMVAVLGVAVPFLMGTALAWGADELGLIETTGFLESVFIGTILTATSVSITVETLKEMGKLSTRSGNAILGAALIDDILGLIALTVVTSLAGAQVSMVVVFVKIVAFFVFVGVVGVLVSRLLGWYMTKVMHDKDLHRFPLLAFVLCLVMAFCAEEFFGVADIIGAFSAGVIIATTPKAKYIESKFSPLSYLLLTPIFFASIGTKVVLPQMSTAIVLFSVLLVLWSIVSKVVGCGLGAKLCRYSNEECRRIGVGMISRGEVALIVANKGISSGLMKQDFFGPVVIMVVVTTIVTPVLLKLVYREKEKTYSDLATSPLVEQYEEIKDFDLAVQRMIDINDNLREKGKRREERETASKK